MRWEFESVTANVAVPAPSSTVTSTDLNVRSTIVVRDRARPRIGRAADRSRINALHAHRERLVIFVDRVVQNSH